MGCFMVSNAQVECYFSTVLYSERVPIQTGIRTLRESQYTRGYMRERRNTTPPPRLWYQKYKIIENKKETKNE